MVKNLPAMQKTWVQPLGWEDPLEKGMATHSSILDWRIPWTEEPGRLYSPWGLKEFDMTERITLSLNAVNLFYFLHKRMDYIKLLSNFTGNILLLIAIFKNNFIGVQLLYNVIFSFYWTAKWISYMCVCVYIYKISTRF